jgi:hypothetical protein
MSSRPHELRPSLPGEGRVTRPNRCTPPPCQLLSSDRRWIHATQPANKQEWQEEATHFLPAYIRQMNPPQRH